MLLGVTPHARDRLVRDGHRLRVYVPFGRHWYGYAIRRLQENPKMASYIAAGHAHPPVRRERPLSLRRLRAARGALSFPQPCPPTPSSSST